GTEAVRREAVLHGADEAQVVHAGAAPRDLAQRIESGNARRPADPQCRLVGYRQAAGPTRPRAGVAELLGGRRGAQVSAGGQGRRRTAPRTAITGRCSRKNGDTCTAATTRSASRCSRTTSANASSRASSR